MRGGRISFNGASTISATPKGRYKQSDIDRSMGKLGLDEALEVRSVCGFEEEAASIPKVEYRAR